MLRRPTGLLVRLTFKGELGRPTNNPTASCCEETFRTGGRGLWYMLLWSSLARLWAKARMHAQEQGPGGHRRYIPFEHGASYIFQNIFFFPLLLSGIHPSSLAAAFKTHTRTFVWKFGAFRCSRSWLGMSWEFFPAETTQEQRECFQGRRHLI